MSHDRHCSRLYPTLAILLTVGVSLHAQTPSPIPPDAARLMSFAGQISVLRDSTAWALKEGDLVHPKQVIVTGMDGYGLFEISDGSKFEVFPKSHVVFRANAGDWKDLLEVWLGKIRVQIEHAGGLPNRNKVTTPSAVISVRGTIFDVEVEDEEGTTLVLDEEGQVNVRHLLKASERVLNPGEWVRIFKNEPLARKVIDKGALLQRAARAASDAFYQAALNAAHASGGAPTTSPSAPAGAGNPADKNSGNPPPPPPPPPAK